MSNDHGFTFLELVVVLLILGLVFGFALPHFYRSTEDEPLRVSTNRLAETIRRVRTHAVSNGRLLRLRLTLPKGEWVVEGMDAEGKWLRLAHPPVNNGRISEGVRLRQVKISNHPPAGRGDVPLRFFPSGEAERAYLYLIDEDLEERTLSVHPFYNRVDIHHGRYQKNSP